MEVITMGLYHNNTRLPAPVSPYEEETELTLEEFIQFQKGIIDTFMIVSEAEELEEYLSEGANIEYTKVFRVGRKKFKAANRLAKKAIKKKDYSEAKKHIKEMKSACDDMEKGIRSVKSNITNAIIGFFAMGLLNALQNMLPLAVMLAGGAISSASIDSAFRGSDTSNLIKGLVGGSVVQVAGIVYTWVNSVIIIIKDLNVILDNIRKKEATEDILNLYRNRLLVIVKDMKGKVNKLTGMVELKEEGKL